jgi:ketosteroid isomerase-like protein
MTLAIDSGLTSVNLTTRAYIGTSWVVCSQTLTRAGGIASLSLDASRFEILAAVSQENVELVRRQIEALNRGDWEASVEGVDSQVDWVVAREHPASRTVHGLDDLRAYREDWAQMLGGLRFEPERIVDGLETVVVLGTVTGTGAGSGAEVEVPLGLAMRFHDGAVVRVEEYLDPHEALDSARAVRLGG